MNPLPTPSISRVVLKVVGRNIIDEHGSTLTEDDIDALKLFKEIYLLAPPSKVMSKRISESQKGLPLSRVVEEILPFDISELVVASDEESATVYVVVKSELSGQISALEERGVFLNGVAFANSSVFIFSQELFDYDVVRNGQPKARNLPKVVLAFSVLSFFLFIGSLKFLFYSETSHQKRLKVDLTALQVRINNSESTKNNTFSREVETLKTETRNATHVLYVLQSLANSLTETAELRQLTLIKDELVLDATASSATQVRAKLADIALFESTEFVTSISTNVSGDAERFRLKAKIAGNIKTNPKGEL